MANVNNRKISNRATRGGSLGSRGSHKSASHNTTRDFHGDSEYEDNLVGWGSDPEVTRYHPNERKGRERKDFEQELRALQDDITMLSKKLSLPIPAVDGPRGRGSIGGIGGESRRIIGEDVNGSYGPGHKISRNGYESDAIDQVYPSSPPPQLP